MAFASWRQGFLEPLSPHFSCWGIQQEYVQNSRTCLFLLHHHHRNGTKKRQILNPSVKSPSYGNTISGQRKMSLVNSCNLYIKHTLYLHHREIVTVYCMQNTRSNCTMPLCLDKITGIYLQTSYQISPILTQNIKGHWKIKETSTSIDKCETSLHLVKH